MDATTAAQTTMTAMVRRYGDRTLFSLLPLVAGCERITGTRGSLVVNTAIAAAPIRSPQTSQRRVSVPYAFENGFNWGPMMIAANEPPPPIIGNSRLACLESRISPASNQNWSTVSTLITSIQT